MTESEALRVVRGSVHIILRKGDGGGAMHVVGVDPGVAWLEDDGASVVVDDEMAAVV